MKRSLERRISEYIKRTKKIFVTKIKIKNNNQNKNLVFKHVPISRTTLIASLTLTPQGSITTIKPEGLKSEVK